MQNAKCRMQNLGSPAFVRLWRGERWLLPLFLTAAVCHAQQEKMSREWSVDLGCRTDSSPAVAPDGTIYLGAFDGKLWALNPNGWRKWTFQTGLEVKSSPAVGPDGTIYFG